jgi:hypothetical protein
LINRHIKQRGFYAAYGEEYRHIARPLSCAKLMGLNMLRKDRSFESAKIKADNLYQLMELINSNITDMDIEQIISLLGLCLDLSAQEKMWMDSSLNAVKNNVIETYRDEF